MRTNVVFRDLRNPHGLAIDPLNPTDLYIAETHRIVRAKIYSDAPLETIAELPGGGRHVTRTLSFGPDGRLYVSIGSTCDVCIEADERNAAVLSMLPDGSDQKIIAKGLRNAVFMRWHPSKEDLWVTEMGRDHLGDDIPPEEVNIVNEDSHYGWPWCYGYGVRDKLFEPGERFDCKPTVSPHLTLQPHSAPLGLGFVPSSWPEQFQDDLLVAQHGSWNSSVKVGYKVVRVPLTADGQADGQQEDFISGWLTDDGKVWGRPVDILAEDDGDILITDDKAGVVYRLRPL